MSKVKENARDLSSDEKQKLLRYVGTDKKCFVITAETEKRIIKQWVKEHSDLSQPEFMELLDSLYQGASINEISIAGRLLRSLPNLKKNVKPECVDLWLNRLHGWSEVDSLCQSNFSSAEFLANWKRWKRLLTKLASDANVNKRRASLVLLTKSVRDSDDPRLTDLAFVNIDRLKSERDILITKAVSWLLRDLARHNRARVERYLKENEETLPKIAVRETRMKISTGRKSPRRAKNSK